MKTTASLCALVALVAACGSDDIESRPLERPSSTETVPATTVAPPTTEAPSTTSIDPTTTSAATTSTQAIVATTALERTETTMHEPTEPLDPSILESDLVQAAIADLRQRLGDPDAEITVLSVEEVTWPDGSIGCPQPGMVYTQALVDGSKIVLAHAGIQYPYHQAAGTAPFHCPPGRAVDR